MKKLKYFKIEEFDSPDERGSGKKMNPHFLDMIDRARETAGVPFKINSGYRNKDYNAKIGGSPTSSHLSGFAADIRCSDSTTREKIMFACWQNGFTRFGIAKTFIHIDNNPTKPPAIWVY